MLNDSEAMAEEHVWDMLGSQCTTLLYVLVVRIHYAHRRYLDDRASGRILEAPDEAVN
jgi:hypothetical protein